MSEIVVIGSLNMDLVIRSERAVTPGETMYGYGFRTVCGGKGANQALACARLGASTSMIGCVGNDDFGKRLKSELERGSVNCDRVAEIDGINTGIAVINVLDSGENSIILDSGANAKIDESFIIKSTDSLDKGNFSLFQLEIPIPCVLKGMEKMKAGGYRNVLTPAPAQELPDEIWPLVDILALNETELSFFAHAPTDTEEETITAAQEFIQRGVSVVIATRGKKGGVLVTKDGHFSYDIVKVDAVDTTAAGDVFCAAVITEMSRGSSLEKAARFASAASALTCTKMGASASLPFRNDVVDFIKRNIEKSVISH